MLSTSICQIDDLKIAFKFCTPRPRSQEHERLRHERYLLTPTKDAMRPYNNHEVYNERLRTVSFLFEHMVEGKIIWRQPEDRQAVSLPSLLLPDDASIMKFAMMEARPDRQPHRIKVRERQSNRAAQRNTFDYNSIFNIQGG